MDTKNAIDIIEKTIADNGMTKRQFALRAKVSDSTIGRLCNGTPLGNTTIGKIKKIFRELEIKPAHEIEEIFSQIPVNLSRKLKKKSKGQNKTEQPRPKNADISETISTSETKK